MRDKRLKAANKRCTMTNGDTPEAPLALDWKSLRLDQVDLMVALDWRVPTTIRDAEAFEAWLKTHARELPGWLDEAHFGTLAEQLEEQRDLAQERHELGY
jgi:hypothetical protein